MLLMPHVRESSAQGHWLASAIEGGMFFAGWTNSVGGARGIQGNRALAFHELAC
jgi:hypothetical protein